MAVSLYNILNIFENCGERKSETKKTSPVRRTVGVR